MSTAVQQLHLERRAGSPRAISGLFSFLRKKPLGAAGAVIICAMIVAAVSAPLIARHDPYTQTTSERLQAPSAKHWFGTDDTGRDLWSRIVYGARISLWVGIVATAIGTGTGSLLGILAGYFGGKFDLISQRFLDTLMAFPGLILNLAIVAALGRSTTNVMIAVGIAIIPIAARVIRGTTLSVRQNVFIEAAQCLGASHGRIVLQHLLPNVGAPIIILATATLGNAILAEAALSFLGLGTPPPNPSWGAMLSGSSRIYLERAPWLAVFPGLGITLAVLAFNLLGDALRDVWDPRLRGSR